MKKTFFFIFLFFSQFFCCFSILPNSSCFLDNNIENKLVKFTNDFMGLIADINTNRKNIKELKPYLSAIDDSLIGISIRDSLLKHISEKNNDELIAVIKKHLKYSKNINEFNKKELKYVLEKRINLSNFLKSSFSFSTVLYRFDVFPQFSMILPNREWVKDFNQELDEYYISDGESISNGSVEYKRETLKNGYDINAEINNEKAIREYSEISKNITLTNFIQIAENCNVGNKDFLKIFQRQQYSVGENDFQKLVATERVYLSSTEKITVTITHYVIRMHIIADIERMKTTQTKILDSILFN